MNPTYTIGIEELFKLSHYEITNSVFKKVIQKINSEEIIFDSSIEKDFEKIAELFSKVYKEELKTEMLRFIVASQKTRKSV